MNLTITKPFGTLTFTADSYQDLIQQSTFFASLPEQCGFKGCTGRLYLEHQKPTAKSGANAGKTFDYYYLRCTKGHELQIHERQADRYPYHQNTWKQDPNQPLEPQETHTDKLEPTTEPVAYLEPQRIANMQKALKDQGFTTHDQQLELISTCLGRAVPVPLLLTEDEARKIFRCAKMQSSKEMQAKSFDELESASVGYAS